MNLEEYVQKISTLPVDINRGLRLIKELDNKYSCKIIRKRGEDEHDNLESVDFVAKTTNDQMEQLQSEYLENLRSSKDKKGATKKGNMVKLMTDIQALQDECLVYSKSKVELSSQNYDIIDQHIEKLDAEMKKFEDELKIQAEDLMGMKEQVVPKKSSKIKEETNGSAQKFKSKIKNSEKNMIQNAIGVGNEILESTNEPVDSNEPTYCYCNGVAFGEMIKCDNVLCEKQWFHFPCAGLTEEPDDEDGEWFCNNCKNSEKLELSAR